MGFLNWLRGESDYDRADAVPTVSVNDLTRNEWRYGFDDGSKYIGGFGPTEILITDYWTLRQRSSELFEKNLYARGLIRRLVTNEINTGLTLEAQPEASILGMSDEQSAEWSDEVESLFTVWGNQPNIVDWTRRSTWGQLQTEVRTEALISGDVLCVMRRDRRTGLPRVQLISGNLVQTPFTGNTPKNEIRHGVEVDKEGRHIAYWVVQADGKSKRLPAFGPRSGRRIAWLVYGTDKRLDKVRGKPILSLIMQSLKEVDRYRDAALRKAVLNSILAMYVTKSEDKPGTTPMTTGAIRRGADVATDLQGETTVIKAADFIPGLIVDELQQGEDIKSFGSDGTDEKFGDFEEAIIQAIAWANEIPPEILRLSFSSNYAASQAAINEFEIYLSRMRTDFGRDFCRPIYTEWLLAAALEQRISMPGFVEAWRNRRQFEIFGAWTQADWSGQVKPSTDLFKLARAYELQLQMGVITRARVAKKFGNGKYSQIVKQQMRENEQLAEAKEPLQAMEANSSGATNFEVIDTIEESETA